MQTIEIKAAKRENLGKAATRELRKSGKVPSVLYGGKENIHFSAEDNEYRKLLYTPNVYIVNLNIDGTNYSA
ncbi:MAG TPA: 50S ribosomal protein L25, partial [Bacteroidales bacterium]|nr:50S ribosomal protein L25 [Bacteroidales bacterium]